MFRTHGKRWEYWREPQVAGERNFLQTPLQLWDFLQRRRDQRPNKAGRFKDKNYAREMNETYSMKCSSRILLPSELGVSNRAQMEL